MSDSSSAPANAPVVPDSPDTSGASAPPDPVGPLGATQRGLLARYWWVVGLAIAGLVVAFAGAFASRDPDGLNAVAIEQGFQGSATNPGVQVLPGYTIPGLDGSFSRIVAGVIGIAVVFLLVLLIGRLLARRRKGRAA